MTMTELCVCVCVCWGMQKIKFVELDLNEQSLVVALADFCIFSAQKKISIFFDKLQSILIGWK